MNSIENKVADIIDNHYNYLLNLQNVTGLGYGYKYVNHKNTLEPCIAVFVNNKMNIKNLSKSNIIPKRYMGINTDVVEIKDELFEDDDSSLLNKDLTSKKIRPLEGGCSVGFIDSPGDFGTICCIVKKLKKLKYNYYILSNNHVLADNGKKPKGTPYTQPMVEENDINANENIIARLETFIPIEYIKGGSDAKFENFVDCAIAKITEKSLISNKIVGIGKIKGTKKVKLGMKVKKVGSTTGLTYGEVVYKDFRHRVTNSIGEYVIKKQIITDIVTKPGDSGSPILTKEGNYIVGMHSSRISINNDKTYSKSNDINIVLKELKVKLYLG